MAPLEVLLCSPFIETSTRILLVANLGVIDAVTPVATSDVFVVVVYAEYGVLTTCITQPDGSAALAKAVALLKLIAAGVPVALVKTKADGVPKLGVVSTGLVSVSGAFKPAWFIVEIAII